jgi:hypothetical protein
MGLYRALQVHLTVIFGPDWKCQDQACAEHWPSMGEKVALTLVLVRRTKTPNHQEPGTFCTAPPGNRGMGRFIDSPALYTANLLGLSAVP